MLKKVLSVVLALVLVLGIGAVAASAATASQLEDLLRYLPTEYNARFYKDATSEKILAARAAAEAALESGDSAAITAAYAQVEEAHDEAYAFEKHMFDEEWDDWTCDFLNRDESKASMDYYFETDAPDYLMPGDTFEVKVSVKANCYIHIFNFGFAYDKAKFEITPESISHPQSIENLLNTELFNLNPHHGFYKGKYVDDYRRYYPLDWDQAMIDKYDIVEKTYCSISNEPFFFPEEKTELCTITVKVKDDVQVGTTGDIFVSVDEMTATKDNYYLLYETQFFPSLHFKRAYASVPSETVVSCEDVFSKANAVADEYCYCDHTITATGSALKTYNFGEEPVALDYTKLEEAVAEIAGYTASDYTEDSWAAYETAVNAGSAELADKKAETQDEVDALTKAVTDARDALDLYQNDSEIIKITEKTVPALLQNTTLEVLISKPVQKIQFVDPNGNTYTYYDGYDRTLSVVNNEDGTQTWTVALTYREIGEKYNVHVKNLDYSWSQKMYRYEPTQRAALETKIISAVVPDTEKYGRMQVGTHDLVVTTGLDVSKVQVIYDGTTATFTADSAKATVVEENGVLVWTISFNFYKTGTAVPYNFKSRTAVTGWEESDVALSLEIVR